MGINQKEKADYRKIIILLFICVVLSFFVSRKEGYHMDELLSFELSNARFTPWIVPNQPEGRLAKFVREEIDGDSALQTLGNVFQTVKDVVVNRGNSKLLTYQADVYEEPVWISSGQFTDYITVGKYDAFQYISVYFNVKDDNHPPIHYMLLHTVSSIFQGLAEPFMGCIINIAAVLGCCFLMMKLGELFGNRETGMLCALLYGLSSGALATTLLIRMYGLMTFFCVALFYLHIKKWKTGNFQVHNKLLAAVTILGFLTQYYFLFYCITLAGVTVFALWKEKREREMLRYVTTMMAAATVGVVLFPFSVSHVLVSRRGVEALDKLTGGLDGYGYRLIAFGSMLLERVFGNWLIGILFFAGLLLLWAVLRYCVKKAGGGEERKRFGERTVYYLFLIIPPVVYFLLAAKMSPYLVDRYIMAIFPFAVILLGCILVKAAGLLDKTIKRPGKSADKAISPERTISPERAISPKRIFIGAAALFLCFSNVLLYDGEYLYKGYRQQEAVAREYADLACICIYEGVGYYENLKEFEYYEKTLLLTTDELKNRGDKASIRELDRIVVLVKNNVDPDQVFTELEATYGFHASAELVADSVYGDRVWLFEK